MPAERGTAQARKPVPRSEALLDAAVEYTFPASDPISVDHAFRTAREREKRAAASSKPRRAARPR
jgi:hypothetical protein